MKNLHSSKMIISKRLNNSKGWEHQSSLPSSSSASLLGGLLHSIRLQPLPVAASTSPSKLSSKPHIPQKLFITQALLLLLAILLIPLADAVQESTESSSDISISTTPSLNETTSMTQTESVQFQRVTITPSYTSTNVRSGNSQSGNFSFIPSTGVANDIYNKYNQNSSHTITPIRRNYSFSFSTSSSDAASPVNKANSNINSNVHPRYRNKINNHNKKMSTVNNFNGRLNPVKVPRRRPQPHQFYQRPRQTLFSADFQPNNPTFIQNQSVFPDFTSTVKPTMHPLRVLQTEISPPVKISVVLPQQQNIESATVRDVEFPGALQIENSPLKEMRSVDISNLANHRMNENERSVPKIFITTTSANNGSDSDTTESAFSNYESHLNDEIKAQLELINQRVPPNKNANKVNLPVPTPATSKKESPKKVIPTPAKGNVEGRSAGENMEQVKRKPLKQQDIVESRNKGNASEEVGELRQVKSTSMNYFDQFTDNIAEEDNQYEVTELVNQYPAQYDTQEPGRDPHKENGNSHPGGEQGPNQIQQQPPQQDQLLPPLDIPTQNPNHNYYFNHNFNNFYKSEKNRPKLNSYYDQNYYADASHHHQHQQHPQHPINNHYHQEYQKHQTFKEHHYYANSDKGDFNGNPNEEVHPHNPGFGPHGQSPPHPQSPPHSIHHQSSPYGPTGSHISHFHNSHHPPPQPYRGEHDIEASDSGNIMDRFEVFYTEHKILTWGAVLIAAGLALVCVVVFLYVNHPPTEVVTARSLLHEYLRDPGLLRFLSNLIEPDNGTKSERRRRRKKKNMNHLTDFPSLLFPEAKEL